MLIRKRGLGGQQARYGWMTWDAMDLRAAYLTVFLMGKLKLNCILLINRESY